MIQYQESNSQGNFNYNAYYYDNISFPYHFHKNMELLHVLEGEVELRLESRAETIAAGQYALIFSNQIHALSLIHISSRTRLHARIGFSLSQNENMSIP